MNTLMKKVGVIALSVSTALGGVLMPVAASADEGVKMLKLKQLNVNTSEALTAIQAKYPGPVNEIELEIEHKGDRIVYEAEVFDLKNEKLLEVAYYPESSQVELVESENLTVLGFDRFDEDEMAVIKKMAADDFSLSGQIAKVKATYPGVVKEVELERKKGVSFYKIKLMNAGGERQKVILDVASGEMIPVMDHD